MISHIVLRNHSIGWNTVKIAASRGYKCCFFIGQFKVEEYYYIFQKIKIYN
jgi:hypothetical protein